MHKNHYIYIQHIDTLYMNISTIMAKRVQKRKGNWTQVRTTSRHHQVISHQLQAPQFRHIELAELLLISLWDFDSIDFCQISGVSYIQSQYNHLWKSAWLYQTSAITHRHEQSILFPWFVIVDGVKKSVSSCNTFQSSPTLKQFLILIFQYSAFFLELYAQLNWIH